MSAMKFLNCIFVQVALLVTSPVFGQQKAVTLDYFFNSEHKESPAKVMERFHYTWEDTTLNGYSIWGELFRQNGLNTKRLETAPTAALLKGTAIYIITDPDTKKESPVPNYMTQEYADVIAQWVKKGGVLVLMANDSANAELPHFNILAKAFGIHFTDKVRNSVLKDISVGKIVVPEQHEIFKTAKVLYLKGICTISTTPPAKTVLEDKGDIIMASSKYGKGMVLAICDPWIYNEYIVNDRLSAAFQNGIAAQELTEWLIKNTASK
jgi:hypothetical protein